MRRVIESDVCIVGSGITAAMVAQKLAEQTDAPTVSRVRGVAVAQ